MSMRCDLRLAAVLAIVSMTVLVTAVCDESFAEETGSTDAPPETPTAVAYGYVSDISNETGNVPLENVDVTLYDAERTRISKMTTGSDGEFSFECQMDAKYYLTFEREGYSVRSIGTMKAETYASEDEISFTLTRDMTPSEDGRYPITGAADSNNAIGMGITTGELFGNVYGTRNGEAPFAIENADVAAISVDGRKYAVKTDSNGYFKVDVAYGDYTVTVSCNGFKDSGPLEASTKGSGLSVVLEENEVSFGFFSNMDAPHSLLAIGMIILILVLLASFVAFKRAQRPGSEITIVNGLDRPEPEEQDDIGHL